MADSALFTLSVTITKDDNEVREFEQFSTTKTATRLDDADSEINVPTSETALFTAGATVGGGQKTLRAAIIHNTDATNFVNVKLADTSGETAWVQLAAGDFIFINNDKLEVSETETGPASFSNIDTVYGTADTAACLCRVFTLGEN